MNSLAHSKIPSWSCGSLASRPERKTWVRALKPNSDNQLVQEALSGSVEAYRLLVERYQSRAHAVAMSIMGNFDDAEDVTQEAFLKAFRSLASFRRQSSFYTWLYRIVFNLAIDAKRKRYRHVEKSIGDTAVLDSSLQEAGVEGASLLSQSPKPDEALERVQLRELIFKAIESLSPEHKIVIMLREVDGLSYSEISDVVGCAKGTVMSRLHHARKRLQEALSEFRRGEGLGKKEEGAESAALTFGADR